MLVLTRKVGQIIVVNEEMRIHVLGISCGKYVKIGIDGDRSDYVARRAELSPRLDPTPPILDNSEQNSS